MRIIRLKIWEIKNKAQKAEEAKQRFEAKQARIAQEEQARKARSQRAAEARRQEIAAQKGEDPVKAALERLKAKQTTDKPEQKLRVVNGEILPDNTELMNLRKAHRLARQKESGNTAVTKKRRRCEERTHKRSANAVQTSGTIKGYTLCVSSPASTPAFRKTRSASSASPSYRSSI